VAILTDPETQYDFIERPPASATEAVLANCRPQPAIPAVLVIMLCVLLPLIGSAPAASGWKPLLIAAGTVLSCGLAVAAGFCSLFPPAVWVALALWAWSMPAFTNLPAYNTGALLLGLVCAVTMEGVQFWRIRTGRFSPTIREYQEPPS